MKLKDIKPGMVIHCKNDEEKKFLLEEAERLGYVWYSTKYKPTGINVHDIGNTIHFYDAGTNGFSVDYKHITHSNQICSTEFSDLIIPELTAEEAIEWLVKNYDNGLYKEAFGVDCFTNHLLDDMTPSEIAEKIAKWKSTHEKKEPEVEWVYRVFGAENYGEKFFQTEEEAIKRCEELAKSQKTKQYARYECVCRVKAVE